MRLVSVLVPLLLLLSAVPAEAATIHLYATTGAASYAARVVTGADGAFKATITSCGQKTGSTDGVAVLLLDGAGALRFGFGVTGHGSPDRAILEIGDLGSAEVTYPTWDPICPYSRLTIEVGGAPGATHQIVLWAAGLNGATSFEIDAAPDATIVANVGGALALGDPELEGGANVQAQKRLSGFNGLGVKVVKDASVEIDISERAWGFWGYNDAKFVCAAASGASEDRDASQRVSASTCVAPATADSACLAVAGTTCGTRIAWDGPAASGAGQPSYLLANEPSGSYAFRVEAKVDAYNPGGGAYVPPGVLVFPGENYGYLSLADVSLPS